MLGYWLKKCPVKTDNERIKATVYTKDGQSIISIASWEENDTKIQLSINWKSLGLDPNEVKLVAPEIKNLQKKSEYDPEELILIQANKGLMLVIR